MLPKSVTKPIDLNMTQVATIVEFIPHQGDTKFANWLGMNLPFEPFNKLRINLETRLETKLINRGEAHVTVITPPEYDNIISKHLSITEIQKIALSENIQKSKIEPVCLGQGTANIDGRTESTWFIVVRSDDLVMIRQKIKEAFIKKGGNPNEFIPTNYYPHITLGYSKRDLHESDGIIKNADSCKIPINSF